MSGTKDILPEKRAQGPVTKSSPARRLFDRLKVQLGRYAALAGPQNLSQDRPLTRLGLRLLRAGNRRVRLGAGLCVVVSSITLGASANSSHEPGLNLGSVVYSAANRTCLSPQQLEAILPAVEEKRADSGGPRTGLHVFSHTASLEPLEHPDQDRLNRGLALPTESLIAYDRQGAFIRTADGVVPVRRLSTLHDRVEDESGSARIHDLRRVHAALLQDLPDGTELLYTAATRNIPDRAALCDVETNLPEANGMWSGGGFLALSGQGLCSLNDYRDATAVGRLIAQASLLPVPGVKGGAARYREMVEQYAEKYSLAPSLIMAIMHTESNFNPSAISTSSALGLMQVVPETAGNEVFRYLQGSQGIPSVETLLNPENNIKYGTTYIHLLSQRYFNEIINPEAREMCIIAAYNGGPGAVLRVFDKNRSVAIARINAMTAAEVYKTLTTRMPSAESRKYVEVVLNHRRTYSR